MTAPDPSQRTRALIESELQKRETILWTGRPIPRHSIFSGFLGQRRFTQAASVVLGLLVLSVLSVPGAIFVRSSAATLLDPPDAVSFAIALAVLPPALVAAVLPQLLLVARAVGSYREAQHVHYVLTQRRALIVCIREGRIDEMRHRDLRNIDALRLARVRPDGIGDVIFDSDGEAAGIDSVGIHRDVGFRAIPDARAVFAAFQRAMEPA